VDYWGEVISFIAGLVGGSLITLQFKKITASGSAHVTDQSGAKAGGDIVGGDQKKS
jgi:hypothetical protein